KSLFADERQNTKMCALQEGFHHHGRNHPCRHQASVTNLDAGHRLSVRSWRTARKHRSRIPLRALPKVRLVHAGAVAPGQTYFVFPETAPRREAFAPSIRRSFKKGGAGSPSTQDEEFIVVRL